jgi:hypothetical protein
MDPNFLVDVSDVPVDCAGVNKTGIRIEIFFHLLQEWFALIFFGSGYPYFIHVLLLLFTRLIPTLSRKFAGSPGV